MAPKRPRDGDSEPAPPKKQRKGFSVGPANLPDGSYKRKVQKIKKDLIHKAKLKKEYAKLKEREQPAAQKSVYERESHNQDEPAESAPEPTLAPHPDRLRLLERTSPQPDPTPPVQPGQRRRPRSQPYKHETEVAQRRKEEAEARRKVREEAERERQKKLAERERFRKAMVRARGGPGGKMKLGRESEVLLEKVKRLVGKS